MLQRYEYFLIFANIWGRKNKKFAKIMISPEKSLFSFMFRKD
jgi:hypothetical protein